MTRVIDQLWYTRPPASATRNPGFQIVAASPGLADPRAKLTSMALRLCRYDAPPRSAPPPAPVSYGWVDAGGTRFCFRRAPAGADELGRPGNLTAHVLAGPPELMRAADLAALFGSAWWWDGKVPGGRELPAMDGLGEVPAATPAPRCGAGSLADRLAAFLDALLARRPRALLTLRASAADVITLILAAEAAVPGLMDAHGVSTYESPRTASWFDVVGTLEPVPGAVLVAAAPQPARTPPVITAARTILLAPAHTRVAKTAARAAGLGTPAPSVAALPGLVAAYRELDTGATPSAEFLATSLARPPTARLTLGEFPQAAGHVAAELIRERGRVFTALAALARDGFDADALIAIGDAAGRELAARPGRAGLWDAALARLAELDARAGTACRRAILGQAAAGPAILAGITAKTRLALLRQAAADGLSEADPAVSELLTGADADWRPTAGDPGLPLRWRAIVVAGALTRVPAGTVPPAPADLAARLSREPRLAGPLAELLAASPDGDRPLREAVQAMPAGEREGFLLAIAAHLPEAACGDLLAWFAAGLPFPDRRFAFMTESRQLGLPPGSRADWAALACATVAGQLRRTIESGSIPRPTRDQVALLRSCDEPASHGWLQVLDLADMSAPARVTPLKSAIAQAARFPEPEASDALRCAVTFFAARRPHREQFRRALAALAGWPRDGVSLLVSACLLVLGATGDPGPATELGYCLIDQVASGEILPGSARGQLFAEESRRLVRDFSPEHRDFLRFYAARKGDPASGWWKRETGMLARVGEGVGQAVSGIRNVIGARRATEQNLGN